MVREVLARVHQAHDRLGSWHRGQRTADGHPVRGGQLVQRGDGGFRAAAGGEVPARAESLRRGSAHAGSARSASLSCWVMRLSHAMPPTALYQTACRHPVARRSITIAPSEVISKYGPIRPTVTAGVSAANFGPGGLSRTVRMDMAGITPAPRPVQTSA